jgi:hypothetical protein
MSGYAGTSPPAAAQAPTLSLEDALKLQRALLMAYSAVDFKAKLHKIQEKTPESEFGSAEYITKLRELTLEVQASVLPMYGFQGNRQGVVDMMNAFAPHMDYPEVAIVAEQINEALGMRKAFGGFTTISSAYENPLQADSCVALQKELLAVYSSNDVQSDIAAIQSFRGTAQYGQKVRQIVTPIAMLFCAKYGFDEDLAGVGSMFRAINEFLQNPEVHEQANKINAVLRLGELPPLPIRAVQVHRFVRPVPGPDGFTPVQSLSSESITLEARPGSTNFQVKKKIAEFHDAKVENLKLLVHKDGFWVTADDNMVAPSHGLHLRGLNALTQPPFSVEYSKRLLGALVDQ